MANDRQYILKTMDGEEYGPADQDTMVRWAQNGRITPHCQIRSTLIARWEKAVEVPFLREFLLPQLLEEKEQETTRWDRFKQRVTMRAAEEKDTSGLHGSRPEDYEKAPLFFRVLAAFIDAVVEVLLLLLVYFAFALAYSMGILTGNLAGYLGLLTAYLAFTLYYVVSIAFYGQTVGQRFWGIILIRRRGGAFWVGRAYAYFLFMLPLGFLTPIAVYVSSSGRSFQEILTGTRMVRMLLTGKKH